MNIGQTTSQELGLRVVRIKELGHILGLSRSTIYSKLNPRSRFYDPSFPTPLRLGTGSVGWFMPTVMNWIQTRQHQVVDGEKE